ncbi:hypothetical protein C8F04DRAFT_62782 [Mycena alexandri]|uniref:F-box domain-containing protein n=1 Tax=Mycena alexandri TaxID=1745969 RepID=A0AAD6SKH6_9AGAR|nr:hypothetical protein C8F04DRAFT_62782 [Mycena alexandri]
MLPDLQADRIRVADLDAQIFELERSLCTIRAQKALVQKRLDSYKYPVLTLPNEIVSEIFVHFLPVYPACPPLAGVLSPTNLTQICRKWRELALATPLLWRAIRLAFNSNIPLKRQIRKIDMWFSMSGRCPISFEMKGYNLSMESKVLVALAPHHARWEHLKLDLAYLPHDRLLFTRPMPLLCHLDLGFTYEDDDEEDEVSAPTLFGEAPRLYSVILDNVAAKRFALPWVQLTSLTLRAAHRDCAGVLKHTPNLVHCDLDFTRGYSTTLPNFTFLHLESLVLADYNADYSRDYMETFVLPALRKLQIAEQLLGPDPRHSLTAFISKSGCKLQKICIKGPRLVSKDAYCTAFPSIQFFFNGRYDGEGTDVASDTDSSDVESDTNSSDVENDTENDAESSDVEND